MVTWRWRREEEKLDKMENGICRVKSTVVVVLLQEEEMPEEEWY